MIVVADTSPLNYLVLLGHIDILAKIYAEVLAPQTVLDELQDSDAPAEVRAWAAAAGAVKSRPIEAEQWDERVRWVPAPAQGRRNRVGRHSPTPAYRPASGDWGIYSGSGEGNAGRIALQKRGPR
jgi:hypothetical protein